MLPRRRLLPRSTLGALVAAQLVAGAYADALAQTASGDVAIEEPPASEPASRPKWTLAPIQWQGQIGLTASLTDAEGQPRRNQFTETLRLSAASYIWQPWFIQLMGGAGLLLSQSRQARGSADSGVGPGASDTGSAKGLTGNFDLHVFPVSRFPFRFNVDVNDSRSSGDFIGSDYRSTRIGLQQDYRTPSGSTSYQARIDSSTLTSDAYGRDRVNVLEAEAITAWETQRVQLNASYGINSRSNDDVGAHFVRVRALHGWRLDDTTSLESFASWNRESRRFEARLSEVRTDIRQFHSLLNWRTDWDEPLTVVASARLYDAAIDNDRGSASTRVASLNGSGTYRFSPRLSVFGAASFSQFETGDDNQVLTSQSVGAQYQFEPRHWGPAIYSANAGIALGHQSASGLGSRLQEQVQAGHRLTASTAAGGVSGWTFAFGQDAAFSNETEEGASNTLVHSGSISWRYVPPTGMAAYASLSLSDSRTHGGDNEGEFQLANLQVSGQFRLDSHAQLSANFTAQVFRQATLREPEPRVTRSISGGSTYQNMRAFGVPRLRYIALFNVYNQQTDRRLQANPDAPREQVSWLFEQRLEYVIGRLDSRLTLRFAQVDGKKNASLIGSVARRFGR